MRRVAISAHSGGSENSRSVTYEHFERSLKSGAEYVELDIRKTADGILVACHDAKLDGTGTSVAGNTYDDLSSVARHPIPRVDEVLPILAGRAIGHLDLKVVGAEDELVELATGVLGRRNFIVTSLEDTSIARVKSAYPDVPAALSLGRDVRGMTPAQMVAARLSELRPLERIRACQADWVAINHRIARAGVLGQCGRHGLSTMVWTVNSPRLIDRFLADPRVEVLITDRPEYALRRRAELLSE